MCGSSTQKSNVILFWYLNFEFDLLVAEKYIYVFISIQSLKWNLKKCFYILFLLLESLLHLGKIENYISNRWLCYFSFLIAINNRNPRLWNSGGRKLRETWGGPIKKRLCILGGPKRNRLWILGRLIRNRLCVLGGPARNRLWILGRPIQNGPCIVGGPIRKPY